MTILWKSIIHYLLELSSKYGILNLMKIMPKTLYLTNKLRGVLEKPFGTTILGKKESVAKKFNEFCQKKRFKKVITVGDFCSKTLKSNVKIFDGRVERNRKIPLLKYELTLINPPAALDKAGWSVIKKAIKENKNIFVDGEEDLLVLPCVLLSEENYLVVYGYPKKGICLIEVSSKKKKEIRGFLKGFRKEKFKKIALGGTFDPVRELPRSVAYRRQNGYDTSETEDMERRRQNKIELHSGHRYFLSMAKYYSKEALIGISSDNFVREKKDDWQKIHKFKERTQSVEDFLRKIKLKHRIFELNDIFGSAVFNKDIEAILLTEETLENGIKVNKERKRRDLKELDYIVIPYFLNGDGKKISSRDFR